MASLFPAILDAFGVSVSARTTPFPTPTLAPSRPGSTTDSWGVKQDHLLISGCGVTAQCQPNLPSDRQHPSYCVCLEVKREYYENCSVLGCVTQCLLSAAHSCEQFLQVQQIGFVTLGPLCCA